MFRRLLFPVVACAVCIAGGADWRQFRGPSSDGIAPDEANGAAFDFAKGIAWKADLPGRGLSGPIVVGNRVFLSASSGDKQDRLHVLAFDAGSGKKLWQRTVWATGPTDSHPKSCMAAPTPASDGQHLVVLFGTNDLLCLNLEGDMLWMRSLYEENPGATDGRGLASSPILAGSTVITHVENQNKSFAAGIDIETGKTRWRIDCPREMDWTTPIVLPGKRAPVVLQGMTRLCACDPQTGRTVWQLDRGANPIASCVCDGNVLYAPGLGKLAAYLLQLNEAPPKLLWEETKLNPSTSSPVVLNGRLYALRGAILVTGDAKTGAVLSQVRLKGEFSSSLVACGTHLYCVNERGAAHVIDIAGKEPKALATTDLGDTILCTPAIANGALYVRSDKRLWKVGKL